MRKKTSRREFLGTAAMSALALPAMRDAAVEAAGGISAQAPRQSDVKRIGLEEHWVPPEMQQQSRVLGQRSGGPRGAVNPALFPDAVARLRDFDARFPLMDEAGVTMQVLSLSSPGIQGFPDAPTAIRMAARINDAQAEVIAKHPGRLAGLAGLPTQDPRAAAAELERSVLQLGFRGAMIHGHTPNWEYLDEEKYWVIWEKAEELGVPLYLHISDPPPDMRKAYEGHPELQGPVWVWGVEAATHALRIIGSGIFDRFPGATLILGHLGESLPYLLGRFDEGYAMVYKDRELKQPLSGYFKTNILITTSGKYRNEALVCAVSAVGVDRVLFAEDYPYVSCRESVDLMEQAPLSAEDKAKIYHLNAERWLKL